jgi:hypothetical protein
MKTFLEIHRAHDMLTPIVLGEIEVEMDEKTALGLHAGLDALCWVLGHDHNTAFGKNLEAVEKELAARGIVLTEKPPAG